MVLKSEAKDWLPEDEHEELVPELVPPCKHHDGMFSGRCVLPESELSQQVSVLGASPFELKYGGFALDVQPI